MGEKKYLGDGLYYEFDGHGVSLTAENGIEVCHRVYLEPEVLAELLKALGKDYDRAALAKLLGQ